jgi:hypothetical protein
MKIHTNMPSSLKPFFLKELEIAKNYLSNKNFIASWYHLERAHILGQPYPYHHTLVHWKMLLGQIPRLLVGGIKSFVGEIPVGNTGGANVPPLKKMDIPNELQNIINKHKL